MNAMFSLFWQVLRFRRSPEDIPYSIALLVFVIIANLLLSIGGQLIGKPDHAEMAVTIPLLSVSIELIVMSFFLHFKGFYNRFVQTATMTIPLLDALSQPKGSPLLGVLGLFEIVVMGWSLGFRAFVYHRALNIGLVQANMFALTIFLLTTLITVKVFPELLTEATAAAAKATKSP